MEQTCPLTNSSGNEIESKFDLKVYKKNNKK